MDEVEALENKIDKLDDEIALLKHNKDEAIRYLNAINDMATRNSLVYGDCAKEALKALNKELEDANVRLTKKVEKEVRLNQKKSAIIYHQSKMVSMGEMIGNIAHQWRQPLSAISTIASGLSFNIDLGIVDKDDTKKSLFNAFAFDSKY